MYTVIYQLRKSIHLNNNWSSVCSFYHKLSWCNQLSAPASSKWPFGHLAPERSLKTPKRVTGKNLADIFFVPQMSRLKGTSRRSLSGACREGLTASSSLWWGDILIEIVDFPTNPTGMIKMEPILVGSNSRSKCMIILKDFSDLLKSILWVGWCHDISWPQKSNNRHSIYAFFWKILKEHYISNTFHLSMASLSWTQKSRNFSHSTVAAFPEL